MSLLKFSVQGKSETATKFVAHARQFQIVVDEPPELGGADDAANPVEYLLASYAGCLNVVGHLVARELKINLKSLEIKIEGDIDPRRLFGQSHAARAGYQGLSVQLIPETEAAESLLVHWIEEVENRCPINDNLSAATPVEVNFQRRLPAALLV